VAAPPARNVRPAGLVVSGFSRASCARLYNGIVGRPCEAIEVHWTEIFERRRGHAVILDLHGQMTLSGEEEPLLLGHIRRVAEEGRRHVILDLTHVSYVDSTGIGEIVGAYVRLTRGGGSLSLCGVSARTQELLDSTNISTIIPSFPDEVSALHAIGVEAR
jgi:anti-anti-sigma factor